MDGSLYLGRIVDAAIVYSETLIGGVGGIRLILTVRRMEDDVLKNPLDIGVGQGQQKESDNDKKDGRQIPLLCDGILVNEWV